MYHLIKSRKLIPYISYITYSGFWKNYLNNYIFDKENTLFEEHVRQNFSNLPDYVYEEYYKEFIDDDKNLFECIEYVAKNFLEFSIEKNIVIVKNGMMEQWQALISITNPIPLVASIIQNNPYSKNDINVSSILPITDFKDLENNFNDIHDTHIHINGTSESFYSWQKALSNPKRFMDSYNDEVKSKNSLNKLLIQDRTTMDNFFSMLETSKIVREIIILFLEKKDSNININLDQFKDLIQKKSHSLFGNSQKHPYDFELDNTTTSYYHELKLWIKLFKFTTELPNDIEALIHFYILAQSQFERILIQQTSQNGFRQFLYISDNMVRDSYEDLGYKDRFKQLNSYSYHKNHKNHNLEIRITPGNFCKKFQKIIEDYKQLSTDSYGYKKEIEPNKYNLSVVCHFIKFESPKQKEYISVEKYAYTKSKVLEQANGLLGCILASLASANTKDLSDFFVGIDAAGYELYAPPEAFAPTFCMIRKRLLEYNKKIGITFHAGEDFTHIISGIRYIYEAYTFIEYQKGDRIGHANALGLDPKKWRKKLNNIITVKQGEWLDDLILFAVKTKTTDMKILRIIRCLWKKVYNYKLETTEILNVGYKAYSIRKYAFNSDELFIYLDDLKLIDTDKNKVLKIYEDYLFNVHSSYDKFIEIPLEEKFDKYIIGLQDLILMEMSQKGIIIESMISSNVRISFYERYKEHHIIKWLDKKHNMPLVTLASDDPGIFNNNIFVEYAHLYEMLDYNDEKFLEYVNILKDNGDKASFSKNTLVSS